MYFPLSLKGQTMLCRILCAWSAIAILPTLLLAEGEPHLLSRGQGAIGPRQPQAHITADGVIDVVFAIGDTIHVSTSRDRGVTFTAATGTVRCPNMPVGMRRGPRIVRTKAALVVTAIGGKVGKGKDGDVFAWQSTDDGATWSEAVAVTDSPAAAREGLHGMSAGPDGEVWCVWLDLRNGKTEIYLASSRDGGQTWSKNQRAYRSPDGSVCECCHPSIIAGAKSSISVLFRNSLGGKRDMFLVSSENGERFSPGRKLGKGSWNLNACPMDGGMVASGGKDQLITVWQRQNQVFATLGNGTSEKLLGSGQQPWVTWSAGGPVMVWTQGREGPLSAQIGLSASAQQIASSARDPVVASHASSDFAVVCWEAKQGSEAAILALILPTPAGNSSKSK